jgi:peptidyl-prolyl cis-trans isomerase D
MGIRFWKLLCRFKIDGQKIRGKCKASHILISYEGTKFQIKEQRTKEEAKVKAEALLAQIKAESDSFMMLAFLTQMIHQRSKVEI